VAQTTTNTYETHAVGPYRYAHDGLELATEAFLKNLREVLAARKKRDVRSNPTVEATQPHLEISDDR
jgi:hypothetical protein